MHQPAIPQDGDPLRHAGDAVPVRGRVRAATPADPPVSAIGRTLDRSYAISTTAFVATYMPYPCGVATFTYDLATAAFPRQIVAIHPPGGPDVYPAEVRHRIRRDTLEEYTLIAEALNASVVDVISLQHEPGIFGGADGAYVLAFVDALRLPLATTLHAVPKSPPRRSTGSSPASSGPRPPRSSCPRRRPRVLARAYGADPAASTSCRTACPTSRSWTPTRSSPGSASRAAG